MNLPRIFGLLYIPHILLSFFHGLLIILFIVFSGKITNAVGPSEQYAIVSWFLISVIIISTQIFSLLKLYLPYLNEKTSTLLKPVAYFTRMGMIIYLVGLGVSLTFWIVGNVIVDSTSLAVIGGLGTVYCLLCLVVYVITTELVIRKDKNAQTI